MLRHYEELRGIPSFETSLETIISLLENPQKTFTSWSLYGYFNYGTLETLRLKKETHQEPKRDETEIRRSQFYCLYYCMEFCQEFHQKLNQTFALNFLQVLLRRFF